MQSRSAKRPCRRVDETSPSPLSSSFAASAALRRSCSSASAAFEATAEADDPQRARNEQLQRLGLGDPPLGVLGQLERAVDRRAEGVEPERVNRDPDLERAGRSGQLQAEVGEVRLVLAGTRVAEIVGDDLEGRAQQRAVADEHAAALERLVEPLVRIERDRVRKLEPAQGAARPLAENGEAAVGRVDVKPDAVLAADPGELGQRVDGAAVRGASVRRGEQREAPGAQVGLDRGGQRLRREPERRVARQHAHLLRPEPEHPGPAGDRRMRLVRDVEHEVAAHRAGLRLARAGEGGHVRGRAAARQRSSRLCRVADPVLEPAEHLELDLARAGRLHPGTRVDVAGARDQVGERAGPGSGAGNEAEEARVVDAAAERKHVAPEALDDLRERFRAVRGRAGKPLAHLTRGRAPQRRRGGRRALDEQVDHAVAQLAHRFRVELERVVLRRRRAGHVARIFTSGAA